MFIVYNSITKQEERVSKIEAHHLHRNTKTPLILKEESVQSEVETPVKKSGRPKSK
jgi:hypothetical protein